MDKYEQFLQACKDRHLRITPQRTLIYKALMNSREHPSAEMIHRDLKQEFPSISLDTVFRTLNMFTEIGMVHSVEGHGEPRRFDPNLAPHHHFFCFSCRELFDFHTDVLDRITLPDEILNRFNITNMRLVLNGYCETCKKNI